MHRILYLASVLRKCSDSDDSSKNSMRIFTVVIAVVIAVAMIFLGICMDGIKQLIGDPMSVIQSFFMVGALISVFFTISPVVNTMYMSNDIPMLLTMPFTANEIISAKIINISSLVVIMTAVFTLPCGVAYGIVDGMGAGFFVAVLLAFICTPIIALSFITGVIILLMFLVRSFRNKDALKIIGGIIAFVVLIAIVILVNFNKMDAGMIASISSTLSKISGVLPINFALNTLMTEGLGIIPILEIIGITAAFFVVFAVLAKFLYIPVALSMQDTSSAGIDLNNSAMDKVCKPKSVFKACFLKEFRHVRREPAYLINGFLMPLIYPAVLIVIYVFASGGLKMLSLENLTSDGTAVIWITCMSILITMVAGSMNAISASCMSREGEDIMILKQTPIDYKTVIRAKQVLSVLVCASGSTTYIIIGGIILSAIGIMPIWAVPYAVVINIGATVLCVDSAMIHDIKHAVFAWESEADMLKGRYGDGSYVFLIAGIVVPIFVATFLMEFSYYFWVVMILMVCLSAAVSVVKNRQLYKVGLEYMEKY